MRLFLHPLHTYEWVKFFNPIGKLKARGGDPCKTPGRCEYVVYHPGYGVVCGDCRVEKLGPFYKMPMHRTLDTWERNL